MSAISVTRVTLMVVIMGLLFDEDAAASCSLNWREIQYLEAGRPHASR
jgi:hypothetical protein